MNTSFSSASLQIGRRCSRQNARLHNEHPADAARTSSRGGDFALVSEERGMIVLLVKHVHLQKDGGAKTD